MEAVNLKKKSRRNNSSKPQVKFLMTDFIYLFDQFFFKFIIEFNINFFYILNIYIYHSFVKSFIYLIFKIFKFNMNDDIHFE